MSFDDVDEPATDDEINQWCRFGIHLVGFTAAGHEGPNGLAHWIAVGTNIAGRPARYYLCGTVNDNLPWVRIPGAHVTCMTCLVKSARARWREPS